MKDNNKTHNKIKKSPRIKQVVQRLFGKYEFKYNFDNSSRIKQYIQNLYDESYNKSINREKKYQNTIVDYIRLYEKARIVGNQSAIEQISEALKICKENERIEQLLRNDLNNIINDVEEFIVLCYNSPVTRDSFEKILDILENDLLYICYLPVAYSGVYGKGESDNGISINSNFTEHPFSPDLDKKGIRRLYLYHEIGHKILKIWQDEDSKLINDYVDTIIPILKDKNTPTSIINSLNISTDDKKYIAEGFQMLEESLTQELAEYFTYKSLGIERPTIQIRNDLGYACFSNHDYYSIFQMPTVQLGRTIRGCSKGENTSDNEVLLNMIKKSLKTNFDLELIKEYNAGTSKEFPSLYADLFCTLKEMGKLKRKKYSTFIKGMPPKNLDVKATIDKIYFLTKRNRDSNEEGIYPDIDFAAYKKNKTL